ncbi:hypothetical protein AK830_g10453 [Neonectria ditissima]|uniref:Nudix hydrolase domain-containing protein n=1 Tax=Neonectria ditissima TaxID=78410 RepID=A0A0P7B738_9HYPO|nr:hypothetical protein AK830_g10453 [Neonectria ditissima]
MAASKFPSTQYTSQQFVESCGAVLFDFSGPANKVCLLHHRPTGEWLLAKGRRNCGEPRGKAALREVQEETGYACHLHPVKMATRAPDPMETSHAPDQARSYPQLTEPFMLTTRELGGEGQNVKLIWWFIAEVDSVGAESVEGEEEFTAHFFGYEEALQRLTFKGDRDVLQRAIDLVEGS